MSAKPYKVHAYPGNVNISKALIIAHIGGIQDQIDYPQDFKMGVDNKTEAYINNVNPTGQVPALTTPDGSLFESNAIAFYLARKVGKGLLGASDFELAQIVQWQEFWQNWIKTPLMTWFAPYNGWAPHDAHKEKEAIASLKGSTGKDPLGILNRHLGKSQYLVGKQLTVADIDLWIALGRLFSQVGTPEFLADLPHLARWAKELAARPEFVAGCYGKALTFATKAPELPKPKDGAH